MKPNILKPESRLTFEGEELDVYHINGQRWLRLGQLCHSLGVTDRTIKRLYKAHRREFTPAMTQIITAPTPGGPQQVRIFSPRGATLIALKSDSPKAAAVCVHVLDVLEGKAPPPLAAPLTPTLPHQGGGSALVEALKAEVLKGNPLWRRIAGYLGRGFAIRECAKLLDVDKSTIRVHVRRMEACGILTPPANLAALQGNVLNFHRLAAAPSPRPSPTTSLRQKATAWQEGEGENPHG